MGRQLPVLFDWPSQAILERAARISLLGLDVDGVLTDGTVWYTADGETVKPFSILDGLGLRLLGRAGITVAVITARDSEPLHTRARDLGIPHLHTAVSDKLATWQELLQQTGTGREAAAYMGDDLVDLRVMRASGMALTVPNAHPALLAHAHWCARRTGGHGAVREACELILAARGLLAGILEQYGDD